MAQLELKNISVRFGGLHALSSLSFTIGQGKIVGLIGPNGAGKTTVFNVLTGVYKASEGDVLFDGKSILGNNPHQIFKKGIARTFQNIRLFSKMTAMENAMVARHCRTKKGVVGSILRTKSQRKEEAEIREKALEALTFMGVE
ncbi:MAG: ATP-binding cassette domain-containing protein, partial [Desulfobacteraceae bacterium]|nr:ATP-binding cassette domain-containing protein [Desulfobacteraceae bacterium]